MGSYCMGRCLCYLRTQFILMHSIQIKNMLSKIRGMIKLTYHNEKAK